MNIFNHEVVQDIAYKMSVMLNTLFILLITFTFLFMQYLPLFSIAKYIKDLL